MGVNLKTVYKLVAVSIAFLFLGGCIVLQSKVDTNKTPDTKFSYIYGHYYLNTLDNTGLSIVLTEYNPDGNGSNTQEYYIGFNKTPGFNTSTSDDVDLIEVPPGKYDMNNLMNLQKDLGSYDPRGRSKLFKKLDRLVITLEPGKAYYMGDYYGTNSVSCNGYSCTYRWRLEQIKNTMDKSTAKLKQQYNHFSDLPTSNLLDQIVAQLKNIPGKNQATK